MVSHHYGKIFLFVEIQTPIIMGFIQLQERLLSQTKPCSLTGLVMSLSQVIGAEEHRMRQPQVLWGYTLQTLGSKDWTKQPLGGGQPSALAFI